MIVTVTVRNDDDRKWPSSSVSHTMAGVTEYWSIGGPYSNTKFPKWDSSDGIQYDVCDTFGCSLRLNPVDGLFDTSLKRDKTELFVAFPTDTKCPNYSAIMVKRPNADGGDTYTIILFQDEVYICQDNGDIINKMHGGMFYPDTEKIKAELSGKG